MNTIMIRIIMLLFVTTYAWGFSSVYMTSDMFNGLTGVPELPKDEKLQNIYDILYDKEKYGFLSTISQEKKIKTYPFASFCGYAINKNGYPLFALSDFSRNKKDIDKDKRVSFLILEEKKDHVKFQKRIVFTGILKKIQEDKIDKYYEITSRDSASYRSKYLKFHPNAGWVEFPDVYMYLMSDIKSILYSTDYGKTNSIDVKKYIRFMQENID